MGVWNGIEMGWPVVDKQLAIDSVGPGWTPLIEEVYDRKPDTIDIVQVKEKFGGLRIYFEPWNEDYYNFVTRVENKSYQLCEECGKPGEMDSDEHFTWMRTLCPTHKKARREQKSLTWYGSGP